MAKTSNHQSTNPTISTPYSTTSTTTTQKLKRTRKSVPRDSPPQRSSVYRGVTRHRWTGRYEAHLWDKNCWNESQNKKGRQVYLGAYDDEEAAARAYDLAALKYWGHDTILNFPLSTYTAELKEMEGLSKEEYIGSLRRKSSGFSRGVSKYRGVARHHHNGRWEARIGRVFGNKYLYLGTYATQEEAATAYDMAAIEYRGLNAVTNFDLSRYIKWLRPNNSTNANPNPAAVTHPKPSPLDDVSASSQPLGVGCFEQSHHVGPPSSSAARSNGSASSALGLLLQSSKFKEMLKMTSAADISTKSPESEPLSASAFPDDVQTYFECGGDSGGFVGDFAETEGMFGDLHAYGSGFLCETSL
ncbi:AP2-like ethylene-responsive transcription factor At1g16060 [Amborella trichopoda]|uniref:AP2/ERF domain-containing protein n=1 Tax=Amborella trichopoda TaxID=13333 RepID=W1PHJ4_AMBTC|nr:AP2-like ethylene-responsive transcription factor At1g16060 [Amborella trichopoda]ERN07096.1 hypothetical protein AMTR_s00019p00086450 [Amborella trichopoda]|eukprot:XP_006845421.1 AP2-like ethylene-responsive transcription factor At1g16060 [Amborella trichopoda]